jgi:hypothetical protein
MPTSIRQEQKSDYARYRGHYLSFTDFDGKLSRGADIGPGMVRAYARLTAKRKENKRISYVPRTTKSNLPQ